MATFTLTVTPDVPTATLTVQSASVVAPDLDLPLILSATQATILAGSPGATTEQTFQALFGWAWQQIKNMTNQETIALSEAAAASSAPQI